jgi:16S rRNA (adenine1518-N6/adenine1519-N6)-dimethyltransferase
MGNLPYNLSSPILGKLMDHRHRVGKAVLMFQAELGRRLLASPGSKTYGALTVMVRYFAQGRELIRVPREAFRPRPKVDSMVLELDFEQPHPRRAENEDHFRKIVKGAFAHRRKTLLNSLRGTFRSLTRETLTQAMTRCGVPLRCRAEDLSVDDFLCLSAALDPLP